MRLRRGGDALDWLLLAMAHWQMGKRSEALDWYTRAREAMTSGQPIWYGDIGILGFRRLLAEAAATLGVTAAPVDDESTGAESGL